MTAITDLLDIMQRLRDPQTGCPWDCAQDYASIVPYTIEEAYEVADAIERGDLLELKNELGDLLFQVVFYAQLAKEQGLFDFDDIVATICAKMIRRHPHVFSSEFGSVQYTDEDQLHQAWEQIKAEERQAAAHTSVLDGVSATLPALSRALKLQKRAARVGFDWSAAQPVLEKIQEELDELQEALQSPDNKTEIAEEYGDLLFSCVNLSRFLKLDPEACLRAANRKFEDRFRQMEQRAEQAGYTFNNLTLDELERLWQDVKSSDPKRQKKE